MILSCDQQLNPLSPLQIHVICRVLSLYKRKRKNEDQGIVTVFLNLALCDISISVFVMPFTAAVLANERTQLFSEKVNSVLCSLSGVVFNLASRTSICLIVYISVTRALVLGFPFMKKCWRKGRNNLIIIGVCWLIGLLFSLIPFFTGTNYEFIPIVASCQYKITSLHEEPTESGNTSP
eukprot:sb/3471741/